LAPFAGFPSPIFSVPLSRHNSSLRKAGAAPRCRPEGRRYSAFGFEHPQFTQRRFRDAPSGKKSDVSQTRYRVRKRYRGANI
jgi:hypothetical protein